MSTVLLECTAILFIGAATYYGLPWLVCKRMKKNLRRRAAYKRGVCLTFDDGPGPSVEAQLLPMLEESRVSATFFLLGSNVERHPELVRQIQVAGHTIGSHGYAHVNGWRASPWEAIADIGKGWKAIDRALGRSGNTYPFRPPNGKLTLITWLYLRLKRVSIFLWTFDSGDTWADLPLLDERVSVLSEEATGVVLLHDFERGDNSRFQYVLQMTARIIEAAQRANVRHMSVLELSQNL